RGVPVEAELRPVHGGLEIDADSLAALQVLRRADDRASGLDVPRRALDRQLARHDELPVIGPDVRRGEGDLRGSLSVEEVRGEQVPVQLLVANVHARDANGPIEARLAILV